MQMIPHTWLAMLLLLALGTAAAPPEREPWPGKLRADAIAAESLDPLMEALRPLFARLDKPAEGSWRDLHREAGQSLSDYRGQTLLRPGSEFTTVYIQPIGEFSSSRQRFLVITAEYLRRWLQVPVRLLPAVARQELPADSWRLHPQRGEPQMVADVLVREVLPDWRPSDGVALLAVTPLDLWAGESVPLLQAHTNRRQRVTLLSTYRFGPLEPTDDSIRDQVQRSARMAVHELAHILNLEHCIAYRCAMNGAASEAEVQARPLHLCPLCLSKVAWNVQADAVSRYRSLLTLCQEQGWPEEAAFYKACLERVGP